MKRSHPLIAWLAPSESSAGGRRVAILASLVTLGLVAGIDHTTSYEFGFHAFYIIPVLLGAWTLGLGWGLALSLGAGLAWYGVDFASGHPYPSEYYRVWEACNHLLSCSLVAAVTGSLRGLYLRQTEWRREHSRVNHDLTTAKAALLQELADRTKAEEVLKRREQMQGALYRIANATLEAPTLQDLYRQIHEILSGLLPAQNFYVAMLEDKTGLIGFPYFVDEMDPRPAPRPPGRTLTDLVFRTGKAHLLNAQTMASLTAEGAIRIQGAPPQEWLGVPLVIHGDTFGVMALQNYAQGSPYGEEHVELLQFIAAEVAASIRRKQAEGALQISEERFVKVFYSSPIMAALSRLEDGRLVEVNDLYCRTVGFSRDELVGRSTVELGLVRPEERERMIHSVEEKGSAQNIEYTMYARDGHPVPCLFSGEVVDVGGEQLLISMLVDLTEHKKAEGESQLLRAEMEQMQKMESLGRLASGVAHDMNNVLGAILALSSAHLMADTRDSPTRRSFQTIRDAATRGGNMVQSLLHFARQSPVERRELDLNALMEAEVRLLEHTTLAKVTMVLALEPDLRHIRGDESALVHAVLNLCVKALDAMEDGGTLTLRTLNLGQDRVELRVEDTGCGMAPEIMARAMDPFFTTKEVGKGTGLGLSMAFTTAKAHGGHLAIQSAPGQGTQVSLVFPACHTQDLGAATEPQADPEPAGRALQLLLVDDDELIRRSTVMLVEILGHDVVATASGEEALALLDQGLCPDAVLLDMNMPGLGGKGTLPGLRARCPQIPVFLTTGRADQDALDLIAAHPGVVLLAKPFSIEDLKGYLRKL